MPFSDRHTPLQLTDMPMAVLFVLAISSVGIYGIVLGGWSSGSTYSLLGALRSSAQMISYEVAMGLALIAVFLYAGSLSTSQIVAAQDDWWYGLILAPSFVIYMISMVGETNRAPFDLARGRGRAGRRLPHRVLQPEVRAVLPGRVHQHGHGLGAGDHAVPRRLARAVLDRPRVVRCELRLLAVPVVHGQGAVLRLHLHLAARHAASDALRPVHGLRLEVPDPDLAGLDHGGRRDPHDVPERRGRPQVPPDRPRGRGRAVPRGVLLRRAAGRRGGRAGADGREGYAGGFPVPAMPAGGAVRGAAATLTFDHGRTVTSTAAEAPVDDAAQQVEEDHQS